MPEEAMRLPLVSIMHKNYILESKLIGICKECQAIFQKKQREPHGPLWNSLQRYEKNPVFPYFYIAN